MKRDKDLTSEHYPIEQILLLYPTGPPFKRHVLDRSGSPRTSACYELLSNEKVNTVFSTDCSLIAAICYGDIYLFQRGSTRQKTGEFSYTPKIQFNMSSLEYFSNMFFNPTTNKIGFIQSHRHRSADNLVVDRRMHRAVHTGERRKFGNRLLDARDERLDGMRERTRLLAAHLPPPERTKPGPNQPVHAVRGQEALAQRLEQRAIRPVVLD